ncbi:vanZ like family protein [Clostridium baratii str. Sullivan]|uniref:VanZ like family protein n=1 Tax=Clostridium baratii str. Sullivan TaxID=1415775 RepID=A0A0A7FV24_9CLOT|nr:VanZ family protein [Clostridium baratii]AIY83428.1 vanZ like family protein [Clostridium baratii str. Sullivan]
MKSINISQGMFFYVSLILFLYFRYFIVKKKEKLDRVKELIILLFGIYIIELLSLVLFPIAFNFGKGIVNRSPTVWLNPMDSIIYIIKSNDVTGIIYNIFGNFILLLPLPIFLIYFLKEKIDNIKIILLICFCTSLGIECIQYIESIIIPSVGRFFETNDILLNTAGGIFGYIMYDKYLRKIIEN